ncbi:hypothetical protein HCN44_007349 [Aphidius gifuensis]|uniref:J domain-containing protein n=1 Tax=Aphidius gifuensis TaxID=684658 RepID=A0A835CLQ4_APHGI|nr:hypothetical protein HCN44_007349 [Aphidius gifuensis]
MATSKNIASIFRSRNCLIAGNNKLRFIKTITSKQRQFATLTCGPRTSSIFIQNKYIKNIRQFHLSNSLRKNYYKILGVTQNTSSKDIKEAYHQLAKKYHPDINKNDPDAEKKFKEISEAFEVLSNDNKRTQYDNSGRTSNHHTRTEYDNSKLGFIKTITSKQCNEFQRQFATLTCGPRTSSIFIQNKYIKNIRQFHVSNSLGAPRKSYYKILGVTKNASSKDIKAAYYQLAKKYHPDINKNNPDAEKKFKELSEAYEVLSDDYRRTQYDNSRRKSNKYTKSEYDNSNRTSDNYTTSENHYSWETQDDTSESPDSRDGSHHRTDKLGFIKTITSKQCNEFQRQFATLTCGPRTSSIFIQNKYIKNIRQFHVSNSLGAPRKNYYKILGVKKNASSKDIKAAYYQLAKKYHPDINKNDPDAEKKFKALSEAYEVLSDDYKRTKYDDLGRTSNHYSKSEYDNSGFIKTITSKQCNGYQRQLATLTCGPRTSSIFIQNKYIKDIRQFHVSNSLRAPTKNYYKILGVTQNASSKDIKAAYFQLAKKYHPDINKNNPDAEKKFKELSEAHEVLSDDYKRTQYDNSRRKSNDYTKSEYDNSGRTSNHHTNTGYHHSWKTQGFNKKDFDDFIKNPSECMKKHFDDMKKRSENLKNYFPIMINNFKKRINDYIKKQKPFINLEYGYDGCDPTSIRWPSADSSGVSRNWNEWIQTFISFAKSIYSLLRALFYDKKIIKITFSMKL